MWSCGLMYANRQDARDGFIPEPMLAMLYPFKKPKTLAAKLVDVGLWEVVPGGYLIHGYHDWNPTKEQVEAERAKGRERAAASYQKRKPKPAPSSPEEPPKSSPEDETKKHVSSGVEWSGEGSGSGDPDPDLDLTRDPPPAVVTEPIQARARRCVADPHAGAYEAPEEWGEVVAVVDAFKRATGQPGARVGTFARDRGVQAVVGLLADGYTVPELETAVARAVAGDWWQGGKRGLSSLSPEVVRRALAADPVAAPRYESADERSRCRNHLLGKAREGEFGAPAKFWERCGDPAALADRLERNQPVTPDDLPADLAVRFARYLEKRREQTANA